MLTARALRSSFYATVFGATERMRMPEPDGRIGHAELQIGESLIMLSDESPELGVRSPRPSAVRQ
jgi:PhnB protein